MAEQENIKHCCCFTGHRPEKLSVDENEARILLKKEIRHSINDGFITFISGMARGIDIWAAETVLKLKKEGNDIHLLCACPFEGFEKCWSDNWKENYRSILSESDIVNTSRHRIAAPAFRFVMSGW